MSIVAISLTIGIAAGALIHVSAHRYIRQHLEEQTNPPTKRTALISLLLITAVVFLAVLWRTENAVELVALWWASALLLLLAWVDARTLILPNPICYAFMWSGLLINSQALFVTPQQALWGAAVGYLSLFIPAQLYRLLTHKEGMGGGDFKLCAGLGAWLGLSALPTLILIASLSGILYHLTRLIVMRLAGQHQTVFGSYLAFGPHLALAGWLLILWGDDLSTHAWLMMLS